MALLLWPAAALANAGLNIDVGFSTLVGAPFNNAYGLAGSVAYRIPVLPGNISVGGGAAWYPLLGQGGCEDPRWTSLSCQLLTENSISPWLSQETLRAGGFVEAAPFRSEIGKRGMDAGVRLGFAMVNTVDDLVALQAEGDAEAIEFQNEWHPAPTLGGFGSFWSGAVGAAIRVDVTPYSENVQGTETLVIPTYLEVDFRLRL